MSIQVNFSLSGLNFFGLSSIFIEVHFVQKKHGETLKLVTGRQGVLEAKISNMDTEANAKAVRLLSHVPKSFLTDWFTIVVHTEPRSPTSILLLRLLSIQVLFVVVHCLFSGRKSLILFNWSRLVIILSNVCSLSLVDFSIWNFLSALRQFESL